MNREELLAGLRSSAVEFEGHYRASDEDLARRYAPGKWMVREVLAHVADCEFVNYWRFARAVLEPGCGVETFDQNVWADGFKYGERPTALSHALFRGPRGMLIHCLESMPDEVLDNACQHPEKGEMSGWEWADLILAHGNHHLGQIRAALDGTEWVPVVTETSWRYTGQPPPE